MTGEGGVLRGYTSSALFSRYARDVKGRFINFQSHLRRANEIMALELQEIVADELTGTILRPNTSTGRLEQAILSPRNRVAYWHGFGVGKVEFLDHSSAKYWRAIEVGTDQFVGNIIFGLWGSSLTGAYGGKSRYGKYPLAGPAFTGHSAGRSGDRLRPMGRRAAQAFLLSQRVSYEDARRISRAGRGVEIKQPILPHWYFREGWERFDPETRAMGALRQALAEAGITARF